MSAPFIHPSAVVEEGAQLGSDVRLWHFVHVRGGAVIGDGTQVGKSCYIDSDVVIGSHCKIQNFVSVFRGVSLGDHVFVGPSAVFTNDRFPRATDAWSLVETVVESGASIGANATVVCGSRIGGYAMIGAGTVVVKDVPPFGLVVGNPGRLIGWVCVCGARVSAPVQTCTHGGITSIAGTGSSA